ncbi:MAG: Gfo/Idh/MocA family oxidoreductase [Pseudomonadota bacterium]
MSDARPDASRDGQIAGPPFRWAILGTGPVSRKFAHGLRACRPPARLHAVVSRAEATAAAFAESFGAPHAVTSIRAAAESGAEALYIASPAHLHEAHATEALAAGLPILVEKPLADSAGAAERLVAAARASHLFAAEAVWTRYLPVIRAVVSHLPEIGLPTAFEACFAVATQHQPGAPLFDPAKGGGALLHRGLYPVSLARAFLGPVARIEAAGRIGMTGVDEEAHLLLTHENGAVSRLRASLVAGGRNGATLSGERAMIEIAPPIWRPPRPCCAAPGRRQRWPRGADGLKRCGKARWASACRPGCSGLCAIGCRPLNGSAAPIAATAIPMRPRPLPPRSPPAGLRPRKCRWPKASRFWR